MHGRTREHDAVLVVPGVVAGMDWTASQTLSVFVPGVCASASRRFGASAVCASASSRRVYGVTSGGSPSGSSSLPLRHGASALPFRLAAGARFVQRKGLSRNACASGACGQRHAKQAGGQRLRRGRRPREADRRP